MEILKLLLSSLDSYQLKFQNQILCEKKGESKHKVVLSFEELELGELQFSGSSEFAKPQLCTFLKTAHHLDLTQALSLLSWLYRIQSLEPSLFNWVGIYFKESFLEKGESQDLVIGPYLGEATEHVRIPLDKGLCGLALREEKIINVADVHKRPEHIACSLQTNSELVIPLKDRHGSFIAELDIDSHTKNAFNPELEERVKELCLDFPLS